MTQYIMIIVHDMIEAMRNNDSMRESRSRAQLRAIYTTLRITDRLELWRDAKAALRDSDIFTGTEKYHAEVVLKAIG